MIAHHSRSAAPRAGRTPRAPLEQLTATRVLSANRAGSSLPVVVETAKGPRLVKLRGAGQGTGALVAEVLVAELAEALGLSVPARSLVTLAPGIPTDDRNDEVGDLLAASAGINLGLAVLAGARDFRAGDRALLARGEAAAILWLDRLVLNPDRTAESPNLLWWNGRVWLIDHGAALGFQYGWGRVTEAMPRAALPMPEPHVFESEAGAESWAEWDEEFAGRLTREVVDAAASQVPASFIEPLVAGGPEERETRVRRRRAAYAAFLWKRLRAPRAFASAGPGVGEPSPYGGRPAWLDPKRRRGA